MSLWHKTQRYLSEASASVLNPTSYPLSTQSLSLSLILIVVLARTTAYPDMWLN